MIDYIFFDEGLTRRFVEKAQELGIEALQSRTEEGYNVALPENLPDEVGEVLEACYDELLERQADLVEAAEPERRHAAGIHINLSDGAPCLIRIEPQTMNRLLSVLSIAELHQLVTGIAHDVENPVNAPICHTPKA